MKKAYEVLGELSETYGLTREWFNTASGDLDDVKLVALQALQTERAIAAQEKQAKALANIAAIMRHNA